MINQQLVQYIRQNLTSGYTPAAIKSTLTSQGFSAKDVDDTMQYVQNLKAKSSGQGTKEYAGFWIRFSAMVWDGIILGIPYTVIITVIMLLFKMNSLVYLVYLAYLILYIYLNGTKGGTPGKLMLGLRIQNEQGKFIGIPGAILRFIGRIIASIPLGIGLLMIAWDPKKQGLHDKIAKTYVIKTQDRHSLYIAGLVIGAIGLLLLIALPFLIIFGVLAYFGASSL